jgi:2-polyprenyl-6-methoxyphenol hydroxylase-like FAD-dependent oxidoreductase
VSTRIIDSADAVDESDPHSKGILIWPRSLELLRRIGAAEPMAAVGHRSPGVGYYSSGRLLGTAWLACRATLERPVSFRRLCPIP